MTAFGSIFTVVLEQLSCSFSCSLLLTAGILQFECSWVQLSSVCAVPFICSLVCQPVSSQSLKWPLLKTWRKTTDTYLPTEICSHKSSFMSFKILHVWQHYPCQMYLLCTVDLLCLAILFARQNQDIGNVKSPLLIWMICKKFKRNVWVLMFTSAMLFPSCRCVVTSIECSTQIVVQIFF